MMLGEWHIVITYFLGLIPFLIILALVGVGSLIMRHNDKK